MNTSDIIVIGGGISGLSSAKLLHERGLKVVVLEARDRVGGRTYTKKDESSYKYVDLGGSYVGPTQDKIMRLASEFGVRTYKVQDAGDYVFYSKGERRRFQGYLPFYWNPFIWIDVNHLFREMDRLLDEIPLAAPWNAPRAEEWDNKTMQEFLDATCWTRPAQEFGRSFVNTNVTMEPSEVSMLWFLWYVKSGGGTQRIWEVDNGGQERKFVGGSQQISDHMADQLGDCVKINSPVAKVTDDGDVVTVETIGGYSYQGKYVVMAIAPTLQMSIKFSPALPVHRLQLIQRVPMGSCIKNQVWYKNAFWAEKGMNGFGTVADGIEPVGNTVSDVRPGDPYPSIVGFIESDQARKLSLMTKEDRQRVTLEFYARLFNSPEALKPVYYEDFDWSAEEYSGGCYTSTYPPGVMTRFGREIRKPIGRLYFAGTETATQWTGYMDGAVEAGERAAREILHHMGKISEGEIWQEEPECEEMPSRPFETTFMQRNAPSVGQFLILLAGIKLTGLASWMLWKYPETVQRLPQYLKQLRLFYALSSWYYGT